MGETIFTCDSDIRLEIPFPDEQRIWALWANHDCKDFDLILTVTLDSETLNNLIGYTGADLTEKGCIYTQWFDDIIACEFKLIANSDNFAILF